MTASPDRPRTRAVCFDVDFTPHPSIFTAVLENLGTSPAEAVMVGDSISHDIAEAHVPDAVPVIESLRELPGLL